MGKNIEITTAKKGDAAVLYVKGDVSAESGGALVEAYKGDGIDAAKKIVLNFDKDCYINSGGLAFLIDIASQSRKNSQKICVAGLSEHFQKIFHMVGLTRCMEIFPSEEEALD